MDEVTPSIGIDFGTSKSCMAWANPKTGQAEVLKNAEGEDKTPSVVYFGEGDLVVVGTLAEKMLDDEDQRNRVVSSIKRDLVSAPMLALPGGKWVKPVEVAAAILRKLRQDAELKHFHQEVRKVVITCPAEFDLLERDAIKLAGQQAGFAEVVLLEEPVAAGIAYQRAGQKVGEHVLVYDLGGGTFDLAVLERDDADGYRLAMEPQGIRRCGGDDFDRALYDYLDDIVLNESGRRIGQDDKLDKAFLRKCREAKEALSTLESTPLNAYLAGEPSPVIFKQVLWQVVFEGLVRDRIEKTVQLTEKLLARAQASGCAVDTVVLIGGSARVPLVIRQLQAALPVEQQQWEKQDVAVALGAAYHAAHLWGGMSPEKKPPITVTVAVDGSGEYTSLEKALAKLATGDTIRLMPGEYPLTKALVVEKGVHLVGVDMDTTTVVGYWEQQVVKVTRGGSLRAEGITFRHSGVTPANVVVVEGGALELTRCCITGGVKDPKGEIAGNGLVIAGASAGQISRCRVEKNEGSGIQVSDQAQPTLEGNTCRGNKAWGIVFIGTAYGAARQNQCVENEYGGIEVGEQAQPTLEGNTCEGNKASGIVYTGSAAGIALQNQCVGDENCGIEVSGRAKPTLEGNTCQGNKQVGIMYVGESAGTALQNRCVGNVYHGIQVGEQAQPALESNTCQDNKQVGIIYIDAAAGTARQNQCVGNERSGIEISGRASPTLESNTCQSNQQVGIMYVGAATGTARQNQSVGNAYHGIQVGDQSQPTLESNTCRGNKASGITYVRTAAGIARQNQCLGNEKSGIEVGEQAQPTLEGNTCQGNKANGIVYIGIAAGIARQNHCVENEKNGIHLNEQAQPTLERNICRANKFNGIDYGNHAGGIAWKNRCLSNGTGGWTKTAGEGQHGIRVENQAHPQLDENVCMGNTGAGIWISSNARPILGQNGCSDNGKKNLDDRRKR